MDSKEILSNTPDFYNPIYYSVVKRPFYRFDFPGLEDIQVNHSQLHQDMFVLSPLNGKRDGTYLEIGANEPIFISNTALLEKDFGWRGVGLELDPKLVASHKRLRLNPCLHADALTIDFDSCLTSAKLPKTIDYLSLDIDPPRNSLAALMRLPHHKYRFRVITFEHDLSFGGHSERNSSREYLHKLGYQLVVGDVSWGDHVVEDWWVDPNLTDHKVIKRLSTLDPLKPHRHDEYFYNRPSTFCAHPVKSHLKEKTIESKLDKGICVEGWRGINHSFALVNQWQLLELLRHPVRLRHHDAPLYNPKWNASANNSGLPEDLAERIRHIPHPSLDDFFSVLYRISFPMDMSNGNADRIFVFGTTEFGYCPNDYIANGSSLSEAKRKDDIQIITPSHWSKQGFINSGYSSDSIHVVPHGVSTKIFRPSSPEERSIYRQILGFAEHDFLLLNVSALTDNKGVDLLLEAYVKLKKRYKQLKLIIKDQSNLYGFRIERILERMKASGKGLRLSDAELQDILPISDNLDMESLQALYNACDAYISPYRSEGFNLPPLEAAACGLPIVVTAGGATDEYYRPELGLQVESELCSLGDGYHLEPDLKALEESIEKIILDPERWGGKKGSALVHKQFGWECAGEKLWDILSTT